MKLLVLVHNNFSDIELATVIGVLDKSYEFEKIDYFNYDKSKVIGQHGVVKLEIKDDIDPEAYDAIFIPGGKSARELREDERSIRLIRKYKAAKKYIFSICDAPNALFETGIIDDSIVYSSYPISEIEFRKGKLRNDAHASAQGKMITGKSPASSIAFALLIVKILFGQTKHDELKKELYGDL